MLYLFGKGVNARMDINEMRLKISSQYFDHLF